MTITFNSNISSLRIQRYQSEASRSIGRTFERLSSGQRINRSSDDAASLAVSSLLEFENRVFTQGVKNANDGISLLNIATGALTQLSDVVGRLKELATQSASGSLSRTQRLSLDVEGNALTNEFNRLVGNSKFNGRNLLDGLFSNSRIQLGFGNDGGISFSLAAELSRTIGTGTFTASVSTSTGANVTALLTGNFNGDQYIDTVSTIPDVGAGTPLSVSSALLAQSNRNPQIALKLLQESGI